jgi:hypothetical protein
MTTITRQEDPRLIEAEGRPVPPSAGSDVGARATELFAELGKRNVDYVVVRGGHLLDTAETGELLVVVRESQLGLVEEIASSSGLQAHPSGHGPDRSWSTNGTGARGRLHITVTTALRYGRWGLDAGSREMTVVPRRRDHAAVSLASAGDELTDLVLHCILDLRAFPDAHRRRVVGLLGALRADPPAAGNAAERIQYELAPALPWSELLAAVVEERWGDLLARRSRITRHLLRRSPMAALRRILPRWLGRYESLRWAAR